MAYNYEVKRCGRCNEHFKYKGPSFAIEDLFGGAAKYQRSNMDYMGKEDATEGIYCPPCLDYRKRAIERAIMLAKRNFERKKPDYVRCSECDGNGTIGGITCPRCEGNGRIKNPAQLLTSLYSDTETGNFEKYKEYLPSDFDKK